MRNPILMLAAGAAGVLLAGLGNPLASDAARSVARADEASAQTKAADGSSDKNLDVRYAQAFLKVAQADPARPRTPTSAWRARFRTRSCNHCNPW